MKYYYVDLYHLALVFPLSWQVKSMPCLPWGLANCSYYVDLYNFLSVKLKWATRKPCQVLQPTMLKLVRKLCLPHHLLWLHNPIYLPQAQLWMSTEFHLYLTVTARVWQKWTWRILLIVELDPLYALLGPLPLTVTIGGSTVRSKWRSLKVIEAITSAHIQNVMLKRSSAVIILIVS